MTKEKVFWEWFKAKANDYYFAEEGDMDILFQALSEKLKKFHPDISFVFSGIKENQKREFVLTAGGVKAAFPHINSLVHTAPMFDDWEVIAFRQRLPELTQVSFGDFKLDLKNISFDCDLDDTRIHLDLYIEGYTGEPVYAQGIFLLLDALLGEFDVETKIGNIEMLCYTDAKPSALPLEDLPLIVDEYFKRK